MQRELIKNGVSGLILVIATLFLFLNARVAFWVTIGIPVSFMATLAVLYGIGGSINMISLFGMIMALGIIVDDAIVVGEDTHDADTDIMGAELKWPYDLAPGSTAEDSFLISDIDLPKALRRLGYSNPEDAITDTNVTTA